MLGKKVIDICGGPATEAENRVLVEAIRYVKKNMGKVLVTTYENMQECVIQSLIDFGKIKLAEDPIESARWGLTEESISTFERVRNDSDRRVINDHFLSYIVNSRFGAIEEFLGFKVDSVDIGSLFDKVFGEEPDDISKSSVEEQGASRTRSKQIKSKQIKSKEFRFDLSKGPETEEQNRVLMELIVVLGRNIDGNIYRKLTREQFARTVSRTIIWFARVKIMKNAKLAAKYGVTSQRVIEIEKGFSDEIAQIMCNMFFQYTANSRYEIFEKLAGKSDNGGIFNIMNEVNYMRFLLLHSLY